MIYPSAARLIINADDYGVSSDVNRAIERTVIEGRVSSFTVMANMPSARELPGTLGRLPVHLSIGLHLNFTSGRPVLEPSRVASLVNHAGVFFSRPEFIRRLLTGRVSFFHLVAETSAQITALSKLIGEFSHFDSHHHVHRFPQVAKAIILAVRDGGGPKRVRTNARKLMSSDGRRASALGLWSQHYKSHPFALIGLYFKIRQRQIVKLNRFASPDYLVTPVPAISATPAEDAAARWAQIFMALPTGCYEINCHPDGKSGEEELFVSAEFKKALKMVEIISYKEIEEQRSGADL